MENPTNTREGFRAVRSQLAELLKAHPETATKIAEILQTVDGVEQLVEAGAPPQSGPVAGHQRGKPKEYRVEKRGTEEVLAEYRADDENPFRCPRQTYDVLATVLAGTEDWVKYRDLVKMVAKELRPKPADYQMRIVLRFWSQPEIGLVKRARARYRLTNASHFSESARKAWRSMK